VFDYVEMFYNPVHKQVRSGMLSPVRPARSFQPLQLAELINARDGIVSHGVV